MKKNSDKKEVKPTSQLNIFENSEKAGFNSSQNQVEDISKIVSLCDFKHQKEIQNFYEIANKLTAHLK